VKKPPTDHWKRFRQEFGRLRIYTGRTPKLRHLMDAFVRGDKAAICEMDPFGTCSPGKPGYSRKTVPE
jgi:hypothetical protein